MQLSLLSVCHLEYFKLKMRLSIVIGESEVHLLYDEKQLDYIHTVVTIFLSTQIKHWL